MGDRKHVYLLKREDVKQAIKEINDTIKEKIDLINPEALINWLELQRVIFPKVPWPRIEKLRELLIREYNCELIPKYRSIVGKEPKKFE